MWVIWPIFRYGKFTKYRHWIDEKPPNITKCGIKVPFGYKEAPDIREHSNCSTCNIKLIKSRARIARKRNVVNQSAASGRDHDGNTAVKGNKIQRSSSRRRAASGRRGKGST